MAATHDEIDHAAEAGYSAQRSSELAAVALVQAEKLRMLIVGLATSVVDERPYSTGRCLGQLSVLTETLQKIERHAEDAVRDIAGLTEEAAS